MNYHELAYSLHQWFVIVNCWSTIYQTSNHCEPLLFTMTHQGRSLPGSRQRLRGHLCGAAAVEAAAGEGEPRARTRHRSGALGHPETINDPPRNQPTNQQFELVQLYWWLISILINQHINQFNMAHPYSCWICFSIIWPAYWPTDWPTDSPLNQPTMCHSCGVEARSRVPRAGDRVLGQLGWGRSALQRPLLRDMAEKIWKKDGRDITTGFSMVN